MSAVDAHAVHAIPDEVAYKIIVRGRLRGHGDHDANFPPGRRGTQESLGVGFQQLGPLADLDRGLFGARQRTVGALQGMQSMQSAEYSENRTEDVTLCAA
jgi:hypothetical protein